MSSAADHQRIAELASARSTHAAFSWFHLHELQVRKWQLELVSIPAPPFQEDARGEWFATQFRSLGLANVIVDAVGNVLGELPGPDSMESNSVVLLSAHLDTVFSTGTDCIPREEDARIYCPGICDNGAGLAALLAIIAAMREAAIVPASTILFAANVGEEGEGDLRGMRHLFHSPAYAGRIAAAIALEGAGGSTVVDRALGSRRIRVTITGPGGHSWADAGRPNPLLALSEAVVAISKITLPRTPRTTLNWGTMSSGTSVNSIPESATADLDIRSLSTQQLDRVELAVLQTAARIVELANKQNLSSGELHLRAERIGNRVAANLDPRSALFTSLAATDRHLHLRTESRIGSTDANLPLSLGVPALAIGAGGHGGGMHTLGEWYDPEGRELALRRILLLLLDTCTVTANMNPDSLTPLLHSPS